MTVYKNGGTIYTYSFVEGGEEVARAIGVVLFREMLIPEGPVVDCEDGRGARGLEVRAPGEVEREKRGRKPELELRNDVRERSTWDGGKQVVDHEFGGRRRLAGSADSFGLLLQCCCWTFALCKVLCKVL